MKYTAMTADDLLNYGRYNLFTKTYPGDYMIPDSIDFLYYSKELVTRAPDKAKLLIDMVLANTIPGDIPKTDLDIDMLKPAGKFWVTAGIAAMLNDPVYIEKIIKQLPERLAKLTEPLQSLEYIALYYDKSSEVKSYLNSIAQPDDIKFLREALADFTISRYHWLGISQTDSTNELIKLWKLDETKLFLTYIEQDCNWGSTQKHIDIDIFAQAVARKPQEAIKLLETLKTSAEIMQGFHNSAKNYWIPSWANFLYRYCNLGDEVLEAARKGDSKKGVVGKKTESLCLELKVAESQGLTLPTAADLADGKLAKKHLYALFSSEKELSAAEIANYSSSAIIWSNFIDGKLKGIFVSDKSLWGEHSLKTGVYKMFNPADLTGMPDAEKIIKLLAKELKTAGISTAINQLGGIYQDFADNEVWNNKIVRWQGNINSQQGMIVTAGKHFLAKGHESRGSYTCYHYINPIDGTGAVIHFDRVWSGPEYASVLRGIQHVEFYKLPPNGFTYSEAVPESMKLAPMDVSPRLKYYIMNVFDSLGKDKASQDQPVIPEK